MLDLGFFDVKALWIAVRRRETADAVSQVEKPEIIAGIGAGTFRPDISDTTPRRGVSEMSGLSRCGTRGTKVPKCPALSRLGHGTIVPVCPEMSRRCDHCAGHTKSPDLPIRLDATSFSFARLNRLRAALSSSSE